MPPADARAATPEEPDAAIPRLAAAEAEAEIGALRAALCESEARFRRVVDSIPALFWGTDAQGQVAFANRHYEHLFGQPAAEMLGEGWKRVVLAEDLGAFCAAFLDAFRARRPFRAEVRVRGHSGRVRWLRCDGDPRFDAAGAFRGYTGCGIDITDLRETEEALHQERERLSAIIGQAAVGIGQWDPQGRLLLANGALCRLLGRSHDDALGLRVQDLTHPEDRPATEALYARLFEAGEPYVTEKRYLRPDGTSVWARTHVSPVHDARGRPCLAVSVVEDVDERVAAERRQALLVRELDHRAKNALAVVQAAVQLTRADDARSFAKAVEGRVAALARAHTLLAAGRWSGADFPALLREELAAFLNAGLPGGPRVELDGRPVTLAPHAAQALSMVVHELATNATKHGALSAPGGHVAVSWALDRTAGLLRLRWAESGGPPIVREPARRGFGSRVVEATVRGQLGGTLCRDWSAAGLVCRIEVPLARAVAGHAGRDAA